jgi:hypothetical protein
MDSPRWYFEIMNLLDEFIFMRNILRESIELAVELKNANPRDEQIRQDENELRQQLTTLETGFINELQRIQRNMRSTM